MRQLLVSFVTGLLFGGGLVVSHMTDPNAVIGFLDIAGDWRPGLGLVMVGAIAVHAVAYRLLARRQTPLFAEAFRIPTRRDIDVRLVAGSALFGIGWALGGFCPGPGLVGAMAGSPAPWVFVGTMLLGMGLFTLQNQTRPAAAPTSDPSASHASTSAAEGALS